MTEDTIRKYAYTKEEVDILIAAAVEEARRIDEESMAKHNREATVISMILGFTTLALFIDGLLRILESRCGIKEYRRALPPSWLS